MLLSFRGCARMIGLALCLVQGAALADEVDHGKTKLGIEFELERGPGNAWQSRGVTLVPGMKLENRWIHMVELLLEGAQAFDKESGEHSRERKFGVRIRHEIPLTGEAKLVLRGLLGHASETDEKFFYYYLEPSFKYAFRHFELMAGYRYVRGIDAGKENDVHKLRFGPSFDLTPDSELEFRWARSWNMHTGQHMSDAYIVEYTRKF